jgi:dTDP-4-amino-4,6-dideoxygalactose transaminase
MPQTHSKAKFPSDLSIPFNKPFLTGNEIKYIYQAVASGKISGNGDFTHRCQDYFRDRFGFHKCLLTTSCTDALEMAAILLNIGPGDEVIIPCYTFVSTANAFVLRGAKIVLVDSLPDHPNMDVSLLEGLITHKTKAIVVVHYAGYPVDMEPVMALADKYGIKVVEDAAQAIGSFYGQKPLGGIGHLGAFSFHETKNLQSGEGGMLVINDSSLTKRAEIIWEKGTDRAAFFRGEIDKYGWVDVGSSFLPSEITAAFLWAQLEELDAVLAHRKTVWEEYYQAFSQNESNSQLLSPSYLEVFKEGTELHVFTFPSLSKMANAHIFYLLFDNIESRTAFASFLKSKGILAVFHYQSLHQSPFFKERFPESLALASTFPNSDRFSDCLLRLPLFHQLPELSHKFFPSI